MKLKIPKTTCLFVLDEGIAMEYEKVYIAKALLISINLVQLLFWPKAEEEPKFEMVKI